MDFRDLYSQLSLSVAVRNGRIALISIVTEASGRENKLPRKKLANIDDVDSGIDVIADVAHAEALKYLSQMTELRNDVRRNAKSDVNDVDVYFNLLVEKLDKSRILDE